MSGHDLHTHTTASDGTESAAQLVTLAAERGVKKLAVTDHDCTDALSDADHACHLAGVTLVPGVEISVTWQGRLLHIVGLNIDPSNPELQAGLKTNQHERIKRAERMTHSLAKAGLPDVGERALELANGMITRTHFARALVEEGAAKDARAVFKRYLVPGKPGYVRAEWAAMDRAVGWIRSAGGQAVVAHPLRYNMTRRWLKRTLEAFAEVGGEGMEVVTGTSQPEDIATSAVLANEHGLFASVGSDFHSPQHYPRAPGLSQPLPADCTPIWQHWK